MIRVDRELPAFKELPEVLDCQMNAEEFPVECSVNPFRFAELAAEEG